MKMIVGLGNPGKQYEQTRHNIGFMTLDTLALENNLQFKLDKTMQAEIATFNVNGEKVLLVKPFTYMNESGRSVQALKAYYQIAEEDTLIIYDDLDLTLGKIRLRQQGSAGGHNGIKSIINMTKWKKFKRLKIGIDRPKQGRTVVDHVLGKFSKEEQLVINKAIQTSLEAINVWLNGEAFGQIMSNFN